MRIYEMAWSTGARGLYSSSSQLNVSTLVEYVVYLRLDNGY
jgi:hypothetical protein